MLYFEWRLNPTKLQKNLPKHQGNSRIEAVLRYICRRDRCPIALSHVLDPRADALREAPEGVGRILGAPVLPAERERALN